MVLEPWVILACGGGLAEKEDPENKLEKQSGNQQENQKNGEKVFSR